MKTIAILLVSLLIIGCSVAGLLVASAQQSSKQLEGQLQIATGEHVFTGTMPLRVFFKDGFVECFLVGKPPHIMADCRTYYLIPKAGAHSEPTGKPDSEKPEKKLP